MITENIYISTFNIHENGTIDVKKTTDIVKDEVVIATSYQRFTLEVNDERASDILDAYYLALAEKVWATCPPPEEIVEDEVIEDEIVADEE